jgi:hypothetical protein
MLQPSFELWASCVQSPGSSHTYSKLTIWVNHGRLYYMHVCSGAQPADVQCVLGVFRGNAGVFNRAALYVMHVYEINSRDLTAAL